MSDLYKNMDENARKHYRDLYRKYTMGRMDKNISDIAGGDKERIEELETFTGVIFERRQYWTIQQTEESRNLMKEAVDIQGQDRTQYLMDKAKELAEKYAFKGEHISIENNNIVEFLTNKVLEGYVIMQAKEGIISLIEKEVGLKFLKIDDIDMILMNRKQLVSVFLIKRDDDFRKFLKNVPDNELDFEHLIEVQMIEESDKMISFNVKHSELTKKKVRKIFKDMVAG